MRTKRIFHRTRAHRAIWCRQTHMVAARVISRTGTVLLKRKETLLRCHYTKSNPIDDHSNISSKKLQKQNFKQLGHFTSMQCGTSHLQTVQENILTHIILATYRKFTLTTVRFTQNVICNIYTHPRYQQGANVTV